MKEERYSIIHTLNKQEILDFSIFCAIAIIITPLIPHDAKIDL